MPTKINSRAKGARGERAWRDVCRAEGFDAFRGSQYSGKNTLTGESAPDVVTPQLRIHWEVKHVEKLHLYKAFRQSIEDANADELPVVAHRRNGQQWLVTLSAEDFFKLIRESDWVGETRENEKTERTK